MSHSLEDLELVKCLLSHFLAKYGASWIYQVVMDSGKFEGRQDFWSVMDDELLTSDR